MTHTSNKKLPLQLPLNIKFTPCPDITAYELALCQPLLSAMNFGIMPGMLDFSQRYLRHFEISNPNNPETSNVAESGAINHESSEVLSDNPVCPVPCLQHDGELTEFMEFYSKQNVKKLVEIGSFYGGTLWHFIQNGQLERLTAVDLPIPPSDERFAEMQKCRALWPGWISGIQFDDIQGDSHDQQLIENIKLLFPENDVDMLHIDGDHTYEGVKADYENFKSIVRPGGYIVFHDITYSADVRRLWCEITGNPEGSISEKAGFTICHENGFGIGVIQV